MVRLSITLKLSTFQDLKFLFHNFAIFLSADIILEKTNQKSARLRSFGVKIWHVVSKATV